MSKSIQPERYYFNYSRQGERGDIDNFPKLVLDALADCGVFRDSKGKIVSDAHVMRLEVTKNDRERPDKGYTEVWVA